MIIAGFDPGSVNCGLGVIDARGELMRMVAAEVFHAPAGHTTSERLGELQVDIEAALDEHRPEVIALEAGFLHGQLGALVSAAARGVVLAAAGRRHIPVVEYHNNTVKKLVAGNGKAEKAWVARCAQMTLMMAKAPEPDAGDALAVAICHAKHLVAEARGIPLREPRAKRKRGKAAA